MKSIILTVATILVNLSLIAGHIDDVVFCIGGVKNEMTYSDSTPVNDGEKYALVWTTNNVEFAGFNCDGTLVDSINSKVIAYLPAKKHKLNTTLIQIDRDLHNPNGTYSLHMLDTRVKNIHTGEYEFIDNDQVVTNIREYVTMAIGYEYKNQFERMPMLSFEDVVASVANGYVEPEVVIPEQTPIVVPEQGGGVVVEEPENPIEEPVISGYLPEKFMIGLLKTKWKSMYNKHLFEKVYYVFKKKRVRTVSYKGKVYIINYKIYNLVPESYLDVCETKKYINRFSEHWVIDTVFVMEKIDKNNYSIHAYEIDENFGMIEMDYFECTKKERSKVLKELRKIGLQ